MAKSTLNWDNVSHNNTSITSITNVSVDAGADIQFLEADNDRYATLAVNTSNRPRITIESSDESQLMAIAPGTTATLVARHRSARSTPSNTSNQNGDITYTMINAVAMSPTAGGGHGSFGTSGLPFVGLSSDGYTNPLSFVKT